MKSVDAAIRREARHEEAGQSALRLREHKERVAHRRRHEPFVPGDAIRVTIAFGTGDIGPHVGAALFLRHAHAHGHAALLPPRREGRIVSPRAEYGHDLRAQCWIGPKRTDGRARHGDRA